MKVRIKKTGQILNVEYDDDDLYKGWNEDADEVWFYASEFDIIDDEELENQHLFTLTPSELIIVKHFLSCDKNKLEKEESSLERDLMLEDIKHILDKIEKYETDRQK